MTLSTILAAHHATAPLDEKRCIARLQYLNAQYARRVSQGLNRAADETMAKIEKVAAPLIALHGLKAVAEMLTA